jgi:hypothetical protein
VNRGYFTIDRPDPKLFSPHEAFCDRGAWHWLWEQRAYLHNAVA